MKASQFRFIVWDNEDKKFVTNVQQNYVPTENTRVGFKLKSRFELFLTTGFNDSNKKEIYDGHVIKVYDKQGLKSEPIICVVQYHNGRFKFGAPINPKELFHDMLSLWDNKKIKYEIIGHIKNYKKQ